MWDALAPHPLHQRPGLLTRLDPHLFRQAGVEALEQRERPSTVACQGLAAQGAPKGQLRRRSETKRTLGKPKGLLHLSDLRVGFRATHQHLHPPPAPQFTLGREPVLELGAFGQREPLEKLTRYQLSCGGPFARCRKLLQPVHIQLHRCGPQPDLPYRHFHRSLASVMPDKPQRLAQ